MVPVQGIEPQPTGSEPDLLPLHHTGMRGHEYRTLDWIRTSTAEALILVPPAVGLPGHVIPQWIGLHLY